MEGILVVKKEKSKFTKKELKEFYNAWKSNIDDFVGCFLAKHLTSNVPKFHRDVYSWLLKYKRMCLAAPRGFAKSMMCSVFYPIHCGVFQTKKDIVIISASEGLAIEWLRKIKTEFEQNPVLIKYFGDLRSGKWTENHIILNNSIKTSIRARGAGAQIRGFRPDLIILDDIETEESVVSAEQRNKLRDWIFKACLNALTPDGQFLWIGTIISPLALLQEILDNDNGWKKEKFRAYIDGVQEEGFELWKELWSHKRLQEQKKDIGSFAFASEFLNDPICNEDAAIKTSHIRYYEEAPENLSIVMAVDPAYSEDERADYKVAAVVGVDSKNNRYLLEYIRTHRPSGEFVDSFLNVYMKYQGQITALGVPNSGTEKEFFNTVVRRVTERQLPVSLTPLKNAFIRSGSGSVVRRKKDRIVAALQPLFEQGRYFLKQEHVECIDELLALGASRHDDIVDTLCYAEQLIQPGHDFESNLIERDRYGVVLDNKSKFVNDYGY